MKRISRNFSTSNDTGFSTSGTYQAGRLINSDGSFNVTRTGLSFFDRVNVFHELLTMPWTRFYLVIVAFYAGLNLLFAGVYCMAGIENLGGTEASSPGEQFMEAFFFSTQTFATVGYGRINPVEVLTNTIASLEALMGVMSFALMTGLFYGRFSRPKARIAVSHNMLVSPYQGITALMFRIANAQKNQLVEAEAQLMLVIKVPEEGGSARRFYQLRLERDKVASMALNWTIVHPINEESPVFGMSPKDLEEGEAEFIFMLKAFDNTYSQSVYTRTSYKHSTIVWGAKFAQMYRPTDDQSGTLLELGKLSDFTPAELPLVLQKTASAPG